MNDFNIKTMDAKYLMNTYKKSICIEKGNGCYIYDEKGKKYLDLIGGIGTCTIGHADKDITKTIKEQSEKIINASNLFYTRPQILLAKKLTELSGLDKCFFSNSGAEAIETAIKLARKHTGKQKIIAMKGGFHGRTMGSLTATWNPEYKTSFEPLLLGFTHVEYGNIEDLKQKIDNETSAIIVEPIQGEGGIIIPELGYLKEIEQICKKTGILLIIDEIQTGNGRTGKYFCYQHENITPDIIALSKGIANGLPIGVTISKRHIDFKPKDHGSTFGGNSLCCAAALKTIEIIETLIPTIEDKSDYFIKKLKSIPQDKITDIRNKGLMIAMTLTVNTADIVRECAKKGLIINNIKTDIIRFLPPLTITKEDIDYAVEILDKVINKTP